MDISEIENKGVFPYPSYIGPVPQNLQTYSEDMVSVVYGTIAWCILYAIMRKHPKLGNHKINGKEATRKE